MFESRREAADPIFPNFRLCFTHPPRTRRSYPPDSRVSTGRWAYPVLRCLRPRLSLRGGPSGMPTSGRACGLSKMPPYGLLPRSRSGVPRSSKSTAPPSLLKTMVFMVRAGRDSRPRRSALELGRQELRSRAPVLEDQGASRYSRLCSASHSSGALNLMRAPGRWAEGQGCIAAGMLLNGLQHQATCTALLGQVPALLLRTIKLPHL